MQNANFVEFKLLLCHTVNKYWFQTDICKFSSINKYGWAVTQQHLTREFHEFHVSDFIQKCSVTILP